MSIEIDLSGRVALVTGGGMGIGAACALALARAGAAVVILDRNAQAGAESSEQLRRMGHESVFVEADVSSEDSVNAAFREVGARYQSLHALVNNAGVNLFKGIESTTLEDWEKVMGVDLRGVYLVTRAALPLLKQARGASVVNIASVHASLTIADIAAYAAAKGGVVSITRSLCQELGPMGIRVNAVSPGFIRTPLLEGWIRSTPDPDATVARVNAYHPVSRMGAPEDVGNLVTFLLSGLAGFITGANFTIDGGLTARLMH